MSKRRRRKRKSKPMLTAYEKVMLLIALYGVAIQTATILMHH